MMSKKRFKREYGIYQTRRGRPMPNTAAVVAKRRPEGYNRDVFGFGTLHHSGMKLAGDDWPRR